MPHQHTQGTYLLASLPVKPTSLSSDSASAVTCQTGQRLTDAALQLWGFVVEDKGGRRKTFYCDSEEDRDGWCWFFQNQAITQVLVSDLYIVDWKNMLGSGYFAAVVRAWDKSTGAQVLLPLLHNPLAPHAACHSMQQMLQAPCSLCMQPD